MDEDIVLSILLSAAVRGRNDGGLAMAERPRTGEIEVIPAS